MVEQPARALMPTPLPAPGMRVLVWGFGRHGGGLAAARFCAGAGAQVAVLDKKRFRDFGAAGDEALARGWTWHVGDAAHPAFQRADLIIASPAIPPRAWPERHPPVVSPEALFFARHRGPRLAVTGTKGKTSTSHLAGALLGWDVAGNSNEPLLDFLARRGPEAPAVCELSSFQLHYLHLGGAPPRFAAGIFTSLARDHLDWHPDEAHYRAAKLRLMPWCDAIAVDPAVRPLLPAGCVELPAVRYAERCFRAVDGTELARRDDLALIGEHNARNAALALAAALHLGAAPADLAPRLRAVRALPHRLTQVHAVGNLRFIDDSIATTPEAAMAALAAIDGPLAVLLGGSDKGADFAELAAAVARRGAQAVLIGQTAPAIATVLRAVGVTADVFPTLDAAVVAAAGQLPGGGTVLLSPGCASLDMFSGFEDRGARFALAARRLRL